MAGIGRFRKNPFETTEPGVIFAPSTLQKSRLDQRYYDWKNRTGVGRQIHPLPDFNKDPVATNINQPLKFLPPLPAMDGRVGSMTALPSQQTQALGSVAQGPPGYGGYSRPMTGHV